MLKCGAILSQKRALRKYFQAKSVPHQLVASKV